eukprot:1033337-Prymnesium_polylepis.1
MLCEDHKLAEQARAAADAEKEKKAREKAMTKALQAAQERDERERLSVEQLIADAQAAIGKAETQARLANLVEQAAEHTESQRAAEVACVDAARQMQLPPSSERDGITSSPSRFHTEVLRIVSHQLVQNRADYEPVLRPLLSDDDEECTRQVLNFSAACISELHTAYAAGSAYAASEKHEANACFWALATSGDAVRRLYRTAFSALHEPDGEVAIAPLPARARLVW